MSNPAFPRALPAGCAWAVLLLASASGCTGGGVDIPCRSDAHLICGLRNPEDLAVTPDGQSLVTGEYGGVAAKPGRLLFVDLESRQVRLAYPLPGIERGAESGWGAADCTREPGKRLSPHGLDLGRRKDGRWQLLVVNHGGGESVESFEWLPGSALAWRGCVRFDPDRYLNDVATLPDGGFVVTNMLSRAGGSLEWLRGELGRPTGQVWTWLPAQGIAEVPASAGSGPNGVALAPDGTSIIVNYNLGSRIRRLDPATGRVLAEVEVGHPDNLAWSEGRLRVASLSGSLFANLRCLLSEGETCGAAFTIYEVDPLTLRLTRVFAAEGAPMGAATVAVTHADRLYLGTYTGDRLRVEPIGAN